MKKITFNNKKSIIVEDYIVENIIKTCVDGKTFYCHDAPDKSFIFINIYEIANIKKATRFDIIISKICL